MGPLCPNGRSKVVPGRRATAITSTGRPQNDRTVCVCVCCINLTPPGNLWLQHVDYTGDDATSGLGNITLRVYPRFSPAHDKLREKYKHDGQEKHAGTDFFLNWIDCHDDVL